MLQLMMLFHVAFIGKITLTTFWAFYFAHMIKEEFLIINKCLGKSIVAIIPEIREKIQIRKKRREKVSGLPISCPVLSSVLGRVLSVGSVAGGLIT